MHGRSAASSLRDVVGRAFQRSGLDGIDGTPTLQKMVLVGAVNMMSVSVVMVAGVTELLELARWHPAQKDTN